LWSADHSLRNAALDDLPPNHPFTRWVFSAENTRFHHARSQPTASLNEELNPKELDETIHYQCLTFYKLKAQATQQLKGS